MPVTYDPSLTTDLDRVRFHLGDTDTRYALPEDANFDDGELLGLISLEGTWQRAVAAGFEALASAWSKHTTFLSGMRTGASDSDIAKQYAANAADWRKRFGTAHMSVSGSSKVVRADAYSTDLDNVTR